MRSLSPHAHPTLPRKLRERATLLALCAASACAQVELRGGAWVADAVVEVGPAGVRVAAEDASTRVFGWHEVKRVSGGRETDAAPFLPLSDDLWRAWLRLQRGDVNLAEPIFERLWKEALDAENSENTDSPVRLAGPTGLVIAEGVARVRLSRGALPGAVEPWATSVAIRRAVAGDASSSIGLLDPQLPPVFVHSLAVERLATTEPNRVIHDDPIASALFDLYRISASRSFAPEDSPIQAPTQAGAHPDVALVLQLVRSQHGDETGRRTASEALVSLAASDPGSWREAWARHAIGSALVQSDNDRTRLLGVVQLLHLPARFSNTQRYLTGLALAKASIEFRRRGEDARAATLRAELEQTMPAHPAIAWMDRALAERAP